MRKDKLSSLCAALLWLCAGTAEAVEPKDTTVTISEAGTLRNVFPGGEWAAQEQRDSVMQTFTGLKIIGPINGTDIPYLQAVCGSFSETSGNISELDLSEADIVSGGDSYGIYFSPTGDMVDLYTKDGEIGTQMFYFCGTLTRVILPRSTASIAPNAFEGTMLESLVMPEENAAYTTRDGVLFDHAVTQLVKYPALRGDADYAVPQSVSSIGDYAFEGSSNLHSVTLPDGLASIGENAFANSRLERAELPSSVRRIGSRAFSGCQQLASVVLPSSVDAMGMGVFMGCTALKSAMLPEGATDVTQMFYGCKNLVKASLPATLTSIGNMAFQSCESLEKVSLRQGIVSVGASAFDGCQNLSSISLPEGVREIGQRAFASCKGLDYLSFPATLDSVGDYVLSFASSHLSLVVGAAVPPAVGKSSFYPAPYGVTLYVPDNSVTDYGEAEGWKNFSTIKPLSEVPENPDRAFNILTEEYVPDSVFRAWIDGHLAGGTGVYTNEEAAAYDGEIFIGYSEDLESLQGIGYFTNLRRFAITNNKKLAAVDLTNNTKLREIDAMYSKALERLDIDGLDSLEVIKIGVTSLTSFDLAQLTNLSQKLRELNLMQLGLTDIDVTPFVNLVSLDLSSNKFKSIDCEGLSKLKMFSCSNMGTLTSVNLHGCAALEELIASMCPKLTNLDISDNPAITALYVHEDESLGNFDFSAQKPNLVYLNVGNTGRTELDLSGCVSLVELEFPNNPLISAPDLADCGGLTWLRAEGCGLKTLDVSNLEHLTELYCYDNALERLDISRCDQLTRLICNNNAMGEIKVWQSFDLNNPPIDYIKDGKARFVHEFTADGISRPQRPAAPTEMARYGLGGQRMGKDQRGLGIVRMSDGTTRKVIVK